MGTRHAQRVVVKRNTCTEVTCNNTLKVGTLVCTNLHNSSLINGIECTCMSQCLSVFVPSLPDRFIVYATYMYNNLVCAIVMCEL